MGLRDLNKLNLLLALVVLLFMAALFAGLYPHCFNSKFNPVDLLKGGKGMNGTNYLTRSLLVVQFSLSVSVLIAGIVFYTECAIKRNWGLDTTNKIF